MLYSELQCSEAIHKAVERMGFVEMTEVQEKTIPVMLAGRDVIAKAPTGTGKTCAFGIPVAEHIDPALKAPQAVILAPTRELAQQIAEELTGLTYFMPEVQVVCVYGGANMEKQAKRLAEGCQIVVATPGRLMDHYKHHSIDLDHVTQVVLDEADEMLNMGFYKDVKHIIGLMKARKSLSMFSATISREVMDIGWMYQKDAEEITVQPKEESQPKITQYMLETSGRNKLSDLAQIIIGEGYKRVMVFCDTKFNTAALANQLARLGFSVDCLHGDLSQNERNRIMQNFRDGKLNVLVATDVAARGIDVDDVDAVINYDIPHDVEGYVHRIGRTGRAGREGKAFTFVTVREQYKIREIIRYTKARIQPGQLPTLRDVSNIRTSKLLDEVRQTLAESSLDRWRVLVEDFQTEHFPDGDASSRDISAALLKLLMQRDFGNQDNVGEVDELTMAPQRPAKNAEAKSKGRMQPLPRRQESGPMSRLHIDVGQAHDVTPRALVGAITGESGIPGRSVGAIDIQNNFSIVEISAELAAHVLATLNKGVFISGVKVSAKAADETDSPHPRKPFAPGQRRQRPGKFGKKPRGATLGRKAYSESR